MVLREYHHRNVRNISTLALAITLARVELTRSVPFGVFVSRFSTGTLGPTTFGLNLGESCLAILLINLIFALPPAYLWVCD
jgi:hypothetical protein